MKTFFLSLLLMIAGVCSYGQVQYEVSADPKHPEVKVLKGIISKQIVIADSSFKWYKTNQAGYVPDSSILAAFVQGKDTLHFVLFGGTWCDDTQFILPRFFKIQELSGISDSRVSFFGVNRDKETLGDIAGAMGITNVPTIIILKNGKELGRVVEYGKTGNWDRELADIINSHP